MADIGEVVEKAVGDCLSNAYEIQLSIEEQRYEGQTIGVVTKEISRGKIKYSPGEIVVIHPYAKNQDKVKIYSFPNETREQLRQRVGKREPSRTIDDVPVSCVRKLNLSILEEFAEGYMASTSADIYT